MARTRFKRKRPSEEDYFSLVNEFEEENPVDKAITATTNPEINPLKIIGEGSVGRIWKCLLNNKKYIAFKEPNSENEITRKSLEYEKLMHSLIEVKLNKQDDDDPVKHCIVRFIKIDSLPGYQIAMSFSFNGSLFKYIHKNKNQLTNSFKVRMLTDIGYGLDFLAESGVVHRDIKSPNILLNQDNNGELHAQIADFGHACLPALQRIKIKLLGTLEWRAPELRTELPSFKSDMYSFGIVGWELLTKEVPFRTYPKNTTEDQEKLWDKICNEDLRETLPANCAPDYAKLITLCWDREPNKRPTPIEFLEQLQEIPSLTI